MESRWLYRWLLVLIMGAIGLFVPGFSASAQDNEEIAGYTIVAEDPAGPHTVQLQVSPASPIVGTSRFAVRVRDKVTGVDVDNAFVRLYATPSEKGKKQYSPALNSPFDPIYYLAQLDLEHVGVWAIDVEVDSELGSGRTVMSIQVQPRQRSGSGNDWGSGLFILVILAFALGISWVTYSSKKALRQRAEQKMR
ncbi:MAG: hypothetical protein CL741_07415 [Chloroflexi bacterium]|nr:hypothetical protein [Chloroflexota bacterium]